MEKPGSRISCIASSSLRAWPAPISPSASALVADRPEVHAAAVVGEAHHDLRALALQLEDDAPGVGLAALDALLGLLDAVHHGVAQHVLERRQHALEHLAVELAGGALDDELGALAGVGRGLAHDAREALHVALERHHAGAHQTVLQLGDGARLLLQQVLRVLGEVLEQLLDAGDVVGGLGERARELLDGGVAIELERIEFAAVRGLVLVPVQDLRLGLDLEAAQLLLEARHRARQLAEVEVERAELLLEARARDARLAGDVQQLIEQLRVDARHFLALAAATGSRPGGTGCGGASASSRATRRARARSGEDSRSAAPKSRPIPAARAAAPAVRRRRLKPLRGSWRLSGRPRLRVAELRRRRQLGVARPRRAVLASAGDAARIGFVSRAAAPHSVSRARSSAADAE